MTERPPVISENDYFIPGVGIDPAAYLLKPGSVSSPGKHSAGQWAHARPYLSNGSDIFVFPVGVEGFQEQGQATLGLHHYIGDVEADGVTVHRDESRITLSGTWPGLTAVDVMVDCRNMLRAIPQDLGLILWVPGIFVKEQYVLAETWTFSHEEDDRSHSIPYTITFVRIGDTHRVADPSGSIPPPNPGGQTKPKGKPSKIFTIKANVRTLRAVAKKVYKNDNAWPRLVTLNEGQLNKWKKNHPDIPTYKIPTYRWPIGTKFSY